MAMACIGILAISLLASGCIGNQSTSNQNSTGQVQRITITGSTTVLPLIEQEKLMFEILHPNADIQVSGGGSSVGVKAAGEETADIGMSSRDLTPEEKTGYPDLITHEIAWDAVVMILNTNNPVDHLTLAQIRGIYNGTITNWKDVGGPDQVIVIVGRDSASGTRTYFSESVMSKENITKRQEEFNSNGGVQQKVSQTPGAIGYVGLGYLAGVKGVNLEINGISVQPTVENISTGMYPLARPLYLLTKGQSTGLAKQFIDYILSTDGQQIVENIDFIPLSKMQTTR